MAEWYFHDTFNILTDAAESPRILDFDNLQRKSERLTKVRCVKVVVDQRDTFDTMRLIGVTEAFLHLASRNVANDIHDAHRPNETELSRGERERARLSVEVF